MVLCSLAFAGPTVQSLQMPAWLERGNAAVALTPGTEIQSGNLLKSGDGGRILLRLQDGSELHLGSKTQVSIWIVETEQPVTEEQGSEHQKIEELGIFVTGGVIRLENHGGETPAPRAVSAQVGEISFIVRSGEAYAATQPSAVVCAISGQTLIKAKGKLLSMQEPYSCFRSNQLSTTEVELTAELARQVAFNPGGGTRAQQDKNWRLVLASPHRLQEAEALKRKLNIDGYACDIEPVKVKGKQHYRVAIGGLVSSAEAQGLKKKLSQQFPTLSPWIAPD